MVSGTEWLRHWMNNSDYTFPFPLSTMFMQRQILDKTRYVCCFYFTVLRFPQEFITDDVKKAGLNYVFSRILFFCVYLILWECKLKSLTSFYLSRLPKLPESQLGYKATSFHFSVYFECSVVGNLIYLSVVQHCGRGLQEEQLSEKSYRVCPGCPHETPTLHGL